MILILFVIHVLIALALIGVVLLQKSEGGALGMGGGMSGFMTGRSTANLLTRTTTILAVAFFATSILLVKFSAPSSSGPSSILDQGPAPSAPATPRGGAPATPASPAPAQPASPEPSAPLAK